MAKHIISTSKKEIYSKVLDIAEKYLPVSEYDFAKTGLFAYITETMAMTLRDTAFHAGMMYNESFLNTAIIPKSIYNWAKMFDIEVQKAVPAYADIVISIDATSIDNFLKSKYDELSTSDKEKFGGDLQNKRNFIVLDRDDPIIAADYYFSLERSIVLYKATTNDGESQWRAEYLTTEIEYTNFTDISSVNNKLQVREDGSSIKIYARAYQYRMTTHNHKVVSSSFLNKVQNYKFEDQFCGAVLYYIENGVRTKVNLSYSDLSTKSNSKVAYYNISDEGELELIFKTGENMFVPAANSNLVLKIYTTKGKNIPDRFTGIGTILTTRSDRRALPITVLFEPTDIYGGKNAPSLSDIKRTIINEISTRKTITTQADLDNYFSILTSLLSEINNGQIKFIKQRDDVLRRIYNAYLLVRSNINDAVASSNGGLDVNMDSNFVSPCVPTNTLDIDINEDTSTGIISVRNPLAKMNGTLADANNYDYQCPFTIFVKTEPVKIVKYIYEAVDSEAKLNLISNNGAWFKSNYIQPNTLRVYRPIESTKTLVASDTIIFEISTTSNIDLYTLNGLILTISSERSATELTANLEASEGIPNEAGTIYTNKLVGKFTVKNTDTTSNSDKYFGFNSTATVISVRSETDNNTSEFHPDEIFNIRITVPEGNTIECKAAEEISVFKDLSDIMESSVLETTNKTGIRLTDVPLVHKDFISNASQVMKEQFAKQLFNYIDILKENLSRLESSTFFNLKFYNTCGYSYFYQTSRTNIDLSMDIYLKDDYKNDSNLNLKPQIRSYIRRLVDRMNITSDSIRFSDIMATLMRKDVYGDKIDHIEFKGPYDQQFISKVTDMPSEIGYAPEWINLMSVGKNESESNDGILSIKFK